MGFESPIHGGCRYANHSNKAVSQAEAIKTFRVLSRDLTVDGGELTPTYKLRRAVVAERFESEIADIYG